MTDSEKLDLILLEIRGMKTDIQDLKTEMKEVKADIEDLKTEMKEVKADIEDLKSEMKEVKADIEAMKAEMQIMKVDIRNLRAELSVVKQNIADLGSKIVDINLHLENRTDTNIQLIAENFIELTNKLDKAIPVADKNLAYEVKVSYLILEVEKMKKEIMELKSRIA